MVASILYKLLPFDSSLIIANFSISEVFLTCVPPHSSIESPICTTLTMSLYFSLNSAIAPSFLASSSGISLITVSIFCEIFSFTAFSISTACSSYIFPV